MALPTDNFPGETATRVRATGEHQEPFWSHGRRFGRKGGSEKESAQREGPRFAASAENAKSTGASPVATTPHWARPGGKQVFALLRPDTARLASPPGLPRWNAGLNRRSMARAILICGCNAPTTWVESCVRCFNCSIWPWLRRVLC